MVDLVSESALRPANSEAKMLVEIASHRHDFEYFI